MRTWNSWVNTFVLASQYNPPRFVEMLMLSLAMLMLGVWTFIGSKPFLVLGLSFVVGSAISILVREAIAPTPQTRVTQISALLMLIVSLYGFADLL